MKSLYEVSAKEVMNANPETVEKTSNIRKVRAFMEDKGLRAVPVEHDGEYAGVISYRELIRRVQFASGETKLKKVMHEAPEFEASDSLVDLAKLRINSGRKLLVNTQNGKLEAVVGDQEFMDVSSRIKEFENYSTRNLATHDLVEAFETDSVEKARHQMLDEGISRIPVLDSEGELSGILRSTDLLKVLIEQQSPNTGGTSGNSLEDTQIAGGSEKESMSDIDVEELMARDPLTIEGFGPVQTAVQRMMEQNKTDILITESAYPEAILTVKDLVDYISEQGQDDFVLVNLVGLEVDEEKAAVHEKIETQLKGSLGRKVENPEEISMHVKKSEKDGKRHRYEIIAKFYTEIGITSTTVEEWDLMNAVDTALEELNTQVRKEKEKKSDHQA
jgi:CBS domain-containing protein/ribosome-associated translation inhibitor RaiA